MYRCLNDLFCYCADKPIIITKTEPNIYFGYDCKQTIVQITVQRCRRNIKTCPHLRTLTESLVAHSPATS